jgi:hypothetical protein
MFHGRGRDEVKENILGISSKGVAGSCGGRKKPRRGSVAGLGEDMVIIARAYVDISRVLGLSIWECLS